MPPTANRTPRTLSRRTFLGSAAALGAGALVACSRPEDSGTGASKEKKTFNFPEPPEGFPTEDVQFKLMDSGDTKVAFWEAMFDAYQKEHKNVTVTYDGLPWNRIEEVAPLGFRNNSSHDLLQLPATIPLAQAVAEGWVAPVDDVIPNFEEWKKTFPAESQVEGVQVFDGKLYQVPLTSTQRYDALIHYSTELLNDAGFDPNEEPFTWDTYRDAARKVTKNGKGQVYGVVLEIAQPGRLVALVDYMAQAAGLKTVVDIRQDTGEFYHTADEIQGAIELLLAIQQDGSILPGSNSLTAPESWPRVARGNAAMVAAGEWVTIQWNIENPEFKFDIAPVPIPEGDPSPIRYTRVGADGMCLFAGTKVPEVSGDVLSYVTSKEGQTNWGAIAGAVPIAPDATEAAAKEWTDERTKCFKIAEDHMKIGPMVELANPDVAKVKTREKPPSPDFGQVIQSILVGETKDIPKALQDTKDRYEKARDDAIKLAKQRDGSTVTRDDYVFKNWDQTKDYALEDYEGA